MSRSKGKRETIGFSHKDGGAAIQVAVSCSLLPSLSILRTMLQVITRPSRNPAPVPFFFFPFISTSLCKTAGCLECCDGLSNPSQCPWFCRLPALLHVHLVLNVCFCFPTVRELSQEGALGSLGEDGHFKENCLGACAAALSEYRKPFLRASHAGAGLAHLVQCRQTEAKLCCFVFLQGV